MDTVYLLRNTTRNMSANKMNCERCTQLESVIHDIWWMARRYATGRYTYAPSMFNDAINQAITLGVDLGHPDTVEEPSTFHAKPGDPYERMADR